MSDDKMADAIQLGAKAKSLLEDETLKAAMAAVEVEIFNFWKRQRDPAERNRAWEVLQMGEKYRAMLVKFVNDGKLSQSDLEAILAQEKAA
jgi:hypothetical protein